MVQELFVCVLDHSTQFNRFNLVGGRAYDMTTYILNVVYRTYNGMQLDVRRLNKIDDVRSVCACAWKDKAIIKWEKKKKREKNKRLIGTGNIYIYINCIIGPWVQFKKKKIRIRNKVSV